jgi:hypothetical protein
VSQEHLVLLQNIANILHVIVGENETDIQLAQVRKLVEGLISCVGGILPDNVLDHGVLAHENGGTRSLPKLSTDIVHGLGSNVVRIDDQDILVVCQELVEASSELHLPGRIFLLDLFLRHFVNIPRAIFFF